MVWRHRKQSFACCLFHASYFLGLFSRRQLHFTKMSLDVHRIRRENVPEYRTSNRRYKALKFCKALKVRIFKYIAIFSIEIKGVIFNKLYNDFFQMYKWKLYWKNKKPIFFLFSLYEYSTFRKTTIFACKSKKGIDGSFSDQLKNLFEETYFNHGHGQLRCRLSAPWRFKCLERT
jgi:hypothetical protein